MKASIDTGCKFFVFRVCDSNNKVMPGPICCFINKSLKHLIESFETENSFRAYEYKIDKPFLIRFTIDEDGFVENTTKYKIEEKDCLENLYEP